MYRKLLRSDRLVMAEDAAKALDVTVYKLRIMERLGNVNVRRHPTNNYRLYSEEDIEALRNSSRCRYVRLLFATNEAKALIYGYAKKEGVRTQAIADRVGITRAWLFLLIGNPEKRKSVSPTIAHKIFELVSESLPIKFEDLFEFKELPRRLPFIRQTKKAKL